MEGLDLGQTSNPSLAWKKGRSQINDDDDDDYNDDDDDDDEPSSIYPVYVCRRY